MSHKFGLLRTIEDSELELILGWRNAASIRQNMYTQHVIPLDEHLAWWERVRRRKDQKYFMYERNDKPLGVVAFSEINYRYANACWAFYSSPDSPRGTGSAMEFLALEFAFGDLSLHKLYCEVLAFNTPVVKLHRKFGFQIEGTFRDQYHLNGAYIDIIRLGMLRHEWDAHREVMYGKLASRYGVV
ncbi:flagellin modification protein FlmH [Salinisphaera shabanensis T35B1]|uniref:UDP-4-amino-4, 6-dideoxy-N-acetyl-beta-L-altrosamine N-acetyltransferase n=1 Tax=Salinisphaera shabanensis TaxID=180542 RepID=UPI00333F80FA